ncbi:hypothetical protein [Burkholderia ubonensis]|uniref:hypothetical protein n=1 Tax=Burkholderia ubonensis TaxID=101571 RepID=UPI0012F98979|nr:hypothetical protein [Burkholderia ubonensis]
METAALRTRHRIDEKAVPATQCDRRLAFADLIARLAAGTAGLDAAQMMEGGPFIYGHCVASLTHEPELAPDCVFLHLDMGPVPANRSVSVTQALLQANHDSCMQRRGFSLSPRTGHIVYFQALALDALDVDDLLVALECGVQYAGELIAGDQEEGAL